MSVAFLLYSARFERKEGTRRAGKTGRKPKAPLLEDFCAFVFLLLAVSFDTVCTASENFGFLIVGRVDGSESVETSVTCDLTMDQDVVFE